MLILHYKSFYSEKKVCTREICLGKETNYKGFHSSSSCLMWSRFSSPVKRYGTAVGLGWGLRAVYDNTQVSGKLEASWNKEGPIVQGEGKVTNKDLTIEGSYGQSEGLKGSIEKTNLISDNNVLDVYPVVNDNAVSLSSFTEQLIQASIILGLTIEIALIAFFCFFIYSYGISSAYTIFKNKLNSIKDKSVGIPFGSLVVFFIIIWLISLQHAFDLTLENSCRNSMEIQKLKDIIEGTYTV